MVIPDPEPLQSRLGATLVKEMRSSTEQLESRCVLVLSPL